MFLAWGVCWQSWYLHCCHPLSKSMWTLHVQVSLPFQSIPVSNLNFWSIPVCGEGAGPLQYNTFRGIHQRVVPIKSFLCKWYSSMDSRLILLVAWKHFELLFSDVHGRHHSHEVWLFMREKFSCVFENPAAWIAQWWWWGSTCLCHMSDAPPACSATAPRQSTLHHFTQLL